MPIASHARLRILLSIAAIVALVSAVAIAMVSRGGITHAASNSSVVTFNGTHKIATRAAQVQVPMQATATTPPSGKTRVRVTPIFKKGSVNTVHAAAVQGSAPHVADMGFGKSKLLHNFHGLNSVDNFNANGFILEPPDQGLCVGYLGKTKVVNEIINDVTAFYTPNGKLVSSKISLNTFFGEPVTQNISDPRCYYDTTTQA